VFVVLVFVFEGIPNTSSGERYCALTVSPLIIRKMTPRTYNVYFMCVMYIIKKFT